MRICVENGTFTIAFLKEGILKVRPIPDSALIEGKLTCGSG